MHWRDAAHSGSVDSDDARLYQRDALNQFVEGLRQRGPEAEEWPSQASLGSGQRVDYSAISRAELAAVAQAISRTTSIVGVPGSNH